MNEEQLNSIIELSKEFKIKRLIQFGSSLDSFENCRDLDFLCDGLYDGRFFSFGSKLEKIFKKQIDLIPYEKGNPFSEYIADNGKLIYESKAN